MRQVRWGASLLVLMICMAGASPVAADERHAAASPVVIDGVPYESMDGYFRSEQFKSSGGRCGTPEIWTYAEVLPGGGRAAEDCTMGSTNPDPLYDPGDLLEIQVVVHIITADDTTTGDLTDQMVQSQIDVLNEDYLALTGTLGENGTYSGIRFVLASLDPGGSPTNGITRTANTNWFNDNDEQGFKTALMWDPNRYLNFYTNNTGYLGYAWFPQWGVGTWEDGIVVTYTAFGRNSPIANYDLGRTATHEVGHWVGLLHTFQDGCDTAGCYTSGDRICDTNPDSTSSFGCPAGAMSCGYAVPIENYMEYTYDSCMERFTPEQVRRARCSLSSYRPDVYTVVNDTDIFADGFESGNTTEW